MGGRDSQPRLFPARACLLGPGSQAWVHKPMVSVSYAGTTHIMVQLTTALPIIHRHIQIAVLVSPFKRLKE
jgi:hypothetical protein